MKRHYKDYLNMTLRPELYFLLAGLALFGTFYGTLLAETGKVTPLEQLKVNRANVELRRKEADRRYDNAVYELFREDGYGLADLNKDGKISLEEITKALKAMGVTQGNLERAVEAYRNDGDKTVF